MSNPLQGNAQPRSWLAAVALLVACGAHAQGNTIDRGDRSFVEQASQDGMAEVAMGQLAQQKGSRRRHQAVRHAHGERPRQGGDELKKLAASKGMTPPGSVDKSHQQDLDKMSKLSGTDFDKAYAKAMLSGHKKAVALFEKESKSGKDTDLKAFAGKTLPTLQEHLRMAQTYEDAISSGKMARMMSSGTQSKMTGKAKRRGTRGEDRHFQCQWRQRAPAPAARVARGVAPRCRLLQETKTGDATFPTEAIESAGYGVAWHGQPRHHGVAVLARGERPLEVRRGLPGERRRRAGALSRDAGAGAADRIGVPAERQSATRPQVRLQARVVRSSRSACGKH
jgi:putative membrane protein